MERFVLSLLFCSAEMSAVALVYMLLLRLLKKVSILSRIPTMNIPYRMFVTCRTFY